MPVVTHEIAFAREVSNRIVFLHEGAIGAEGTPAEVFSTAASARLQRFLTR